MGRSRPRPEAEASTTLDDDLEAMEPLLKALEGGENVRRFREGARRMQAELPKLQAEYAALSADVPRLRTQQRELQAAIAQTMDEVMALEQRGRVVPLPKSMTRAR